MNKQQNTFLHKLYLTYKFYFNFNSFLQFFLYNSNSPKNGFSVLKITPNFQTKV